MLKGPRARVDLWKFGGPVKRGRHDSLVSRKGFSTPASSPSVKNIHGTRADVIFDLAVKRNGGRHRANKPGLLFSVDYTPRLRLSPFGFKENDEVKERERSKARVVFEKSELAAIGLVFDKIVAATEAVASSNKRDNGRS